MIQISVTTIIICAILIVAAFITPLINIFFRKVEDEESATDDSQLPCLSVLLTVQDNARELEQHLPAMLTQDYPAGFEVIVVVGKGEDDTDDVLKKLSATYPNLYTTFIPDSSRYMSRKKLAVTLGVKAARHEWILMTEASCQPASDQWLKTMARHCQKMLTCRILNTMIRRKRQLTMPGNTEFPFLPADLALARQLHSEA